MKGLQRHHLVELADRIEKPHARRNWFKAVRGLLQYAVEIGMRLDDPTSALKIGTLPKTDGFRTWSEPDIMAFRQHHAIGTRARLAFELLLNTGQRRGDVIRMGRQHLHGGKLTVRQSKTGTTLKIPIRSELAAVIEATPADNLTFLTTAFGKPFAPAGLEIGSERCATRRACTVSVRTVYARPRAASWLRPDALPMKSAAISGHRTLGEVARYTRAADQEAMAEAVMAKVRTSSVKKAEPRVSNKVQAIGNKHK